MREKKQNKSSCSRAHERAVYHHPPLVVVFGEEARHGAPHQSYEVFSPHDDARHSRSQTQLSEVQGEEGEQAGSGAAAQEVKSAGQSKGMLDVNLLIPLHDRLPGQLTVCPDRFHMEQLILFLTTAAQTSLKFSIGHFSPRTSALHPRFRSLLCLERRTPVTVCTMNPFNGTEAFHLETYYSDCSAP